jgi:CsoR family transcriptional regulator, copper-sensing transcriptional repressor
VHVEDVIGADRRRWWRRDGLVAGTGDHEPEGGACAGGAIDLQKHELVAPGEELEPFGGDALLADGASKPVGEHEAVIQRIHPSVSVPRPSFGRPWPDRLWRIPPGGIIEPMASIDTPVAVNIERDGADHFRHSYTRDKAQLVRRLARIEGQVRGISRMIEREEYCVDILQQTSALRAAVDSLAILVLEDHVTGCVRTAAEQGNAEKYVEEVVDVVRRTLGRPVRSATRS